MVAVNVRYLVLAEILYFLWKMDSKTIGKITVLGGFLVFTRHGVGILVSSHVQINSVDPCGHADVLGIL